MSNDVQSEFISIEELLEWTIKEDGVLKKIGMIKNPNTVLSTGLNNVAMLVGGLDNKTIDAYWVTRDGALAYHPARCWNETSNNTLVVNQDFYGSPGRDYFTIPGTYTNVFLGNWSVGSLNPYSSIACNIVLGVDQELQFKTKWIFTGNTLGTDGSRICAARVGGTAINGSHYDYPVSTIVVFDNVGIPLNSLALTNSVTGSTLWCNHNAWLAGYNVYSMARYETSYGVLADRMFDRFDGFTITLYAGSSLAFVGKFIFQQSA